MGYRDIYKESNEQAEERFLLVMERIAEIAEETDVPILLGHGTRKQAVSKKRWNQFSMSLDW